MAFGVLRHPFCHRSEDFVFVDATDPAGIRTADRMGGRDPSPRGELQFRQLPGVVTRELVRRHVPVFRQGCRSVDFLVSTAGLPNGLRHRALEAEHAKFVADADHAAVLDLSLIHI